MLSMPSVSLSDPIRRLPSLPVSDPIRTQFDGPARCEFSWSQMGCSVGCETGRWGAGAAQPERAPKNISWLAATKAVPQFRSLIKSIEIRLKTLRWERKSPGWMDILFKVVSKDSPFSTRCVVEVRANIVRKTCLSTTRLFVRFSDQGGIGGLKY